MSSDIAMIDDEAMCKSEDLNVEMSLSINSTDEPHPTSKLEPSYSCKHILTWTGLLGNST